MVTYLSLDLLLQTKPTTDFFLKIIGLNSSLQAVFHLPNYANPRTDATKFSELLGGTPFFGLQFGG